MEPRQWKILGNLRIALTSFAPALTPSVTLREGCAVSIGPQLVAALPEGRN